MTASSILVRLTCAPLLTSLLVLLGLASTATAQQIESAAVCDEPAIREPVAHSYGSHSSGCAIAPGTDIDTFVFEGTSGDVVRFIVLSKTGYFDPTLQIRDPDGQLIDQGSCSGSGGARCSFVRQVVLGSTGTHYLAVADSGSNEEGGYILQLERITPEAAQASVAYDGQQSDTIGVGTDVDFFTFEGEADDDIRVNVLSRTGYFDPRVEIYDPLGARIHDEACGGGGGVRCSFSVDFKLGSTGTYWIAVSDSGSNETGGYQLGLDCLFGDCDPADPPVLAYDEPLADAIAPATDGDVYVFSVPAGDEARLNVLSRTGYFDPRVELVDSSGETVADELCSGGGGAQCAFAIDLAPEESETYRLILHDSSVNETGNYELSLDCHFGACAGVDRPMVSYVRAVGSSVAPRVDGDFYEFHGVEGTLVGLHVLSATGYFDPHVEVRDPNGNLLVDQLCSGVGGTRCSFSQRLALSETGTYRISVYDAGRNETGGYELSLHCFAGACDSDSDGVPDGNRPPLRYGETVRGAIGPGTDVDFYSLEITPGATAYLNVLSRTGYFDPHVQILDRDGNVLDQELCSGIGGARCSFQVELTGLAAGTHVLAIRDSGINESGGYEIGLQCIFPACDDPPAESAKGDNCILVPNGPAASTALCSAQEDGDQDGYGDACDTDVDNDLETSLADVMLVLSESQVLSNDPVYDFDCDGAAGLDDVGQAWNDALRSTTPGPSGQACAGSIPCP